jgi:phosphoribosylanthranilate isomerase
MTKIKICGLSKPCDIDFVNDAQPDYIGFVFAKSKRQVTPEQAKLLRKSLNKNITVVGVFVNEPLEHVASMLEEGIIDIPQLHGQEDEAYIKKLKAIVNAPVIKAVKVVDRGDITWAEECSADYLLLDNGPGGTGQRFDWSLIEAVNKPFFLAGGINCDNVKEAIGRVNPFAVDTSSGVETEGKKDKSKIMEFVRRAKNV